MVKFTRCQKADIHDKESGRVIPAEVRGGPMDGLLIVVPREYNCPSDGRVEIVFYHPELGLITCDCILSTPFIEDDHKHMSYRCQVLDERGREQRREDIKITLSSSVVVTLESELEGERQEASAILRDISAGGVYIITNLIARKGMVMSFIFDEAGVSMPLFAEILRVEKQTDRRGRPTFGYGCRFVHLSGRYESRLRSYIFQEEKRRHSYE